MLEEALLVSPLNREQRCSVAAHRAAIVTCQLCKLAQVASSSLPVRPRSRSVGPNGILVLAANAPKDDLGLGGGDAGGGVKVPHERAGERCGERRVARDRRGTEGGRNDGRWRRAALGLRKVGFKKGSFSMHIYLEFCSVH